MRSTFAWGMGHGVLQCGCRNLRLHMTAPCTMPFAPCDKTLHGVQYERKINTCSGAKVGFLSASSIQHPALIEHCAFTIKHWKLP